MVMPTKKRKKGFVCIICPKCCQLEVEGSVVGGAKCERGEGFGLQEAVMPLRTVTTTLRCETEKGTKMVPVKTSAPVPLVHVLDIMKQIKRIRLSGFPRIGSEIKVTTTPEPIDLIVAGD
jgi:CxxC motif-containing protein